MNADNADKKKNQRHLRSSASRSLNRVNVQFSVEHGPRSALVQDTN